MYKSIDIINKVEHKNKAIKVVENFSYAKEQRDVPVTLVEFYEACKNYPIVFVKDKNNSWFASIMLGIKENENLFVDEKGNWEKFNYVPAFVRRYPFIFLNQEKNEELILGVEKAYICEEKDNKQRKLFEKESNSEFLNGVLNFLNQFQNDAKTTSNFIKQLEEWELLEEKTATLVLADKKQFNINGFYVVNEEKLKHLSKKRKEELCEKDMIPLITAHLISLSNIQKLANK